MKEEEKARKIATAAGSYLLSACGVALLTLAINALRLDAGTANVSMLYLLVVILSALFLGSGPAISASVLSFLAVNWFFVTPRYTFTVAENSEWLALVMFLLTATVTGQLMAQLKTRAWEARQNQKETRVLAETSWAVASQLDTQSALIEIVRQVARVVELQVAAVIALREGKPELAALYPPDYDKPPDPVRAIALAALETKNGHQPARVAESENGDGEMVVPILIADQITGAVFLKSGSGRKFHARERQIIDSLVNHAAVILQRERLFKKESQAAALADADRLKTALLSMVSHDFRSPLTSIKASVSALLEDGAPLDAETQRGLYQGIEQEADRLNRMVGNILDLSRLESDAWRPKLETTAVDELIGMVVDGFDAASNKRIKITLDPELKELRVDCVQMVQVLKNLVENALKYSDDLVEIRTIAAADSAMIEVLDSGGGLSAGEDEKIFAPFYRGAHLQESSVPGVGIGLAVCRGLVEAHGGQLVAENRENRGTIFRVTLARMLN